MKDPGTETSDGPGWECGLHSSLASVSVAEPVFCSSNIKEKSTCFSIFTHPTCGWTEGMREVLANGIGTLPGLAPKICPEILSAFSSLRQSCSSLVRAARIPESPATEEHTESLLTCARLCWGDAPGSYEGTEI